jgi:hypothetical protein
MISYPSTSDTLAKVQDYKLNFMNLSLPRNKWWHEYTHNKDFKIKVTWGKDNYFFVYALWAHPVEFSDPDEFGWGDGQIKPYKAWIFLCTSSPSTIAFDIDAFQNDIFQIFQSMGFQAGSFQADSFSIISSGDFYWVVVEDADIPSWTEDAFLSERKTIKALP